MKTTDVRPVCAAQDMKLVARHVQAMPTAVPYLFRLDNGLETIFLLFCRTPTPTKTLSRTAARRVEQVVESLAHPQSHTSGKEMDRKGDSQVQQQ